MITLRVLIPDMPAADDLLPYLRRIDAEKRYVNGGPLVRELEQALSDLVYAPVTAVSNGTAALELALRALRLPRGSCVAVPVATFVGSGQAITNAQLKPVLCDVDPVTWQLTPQAVVDAAEGWPIRAAMPVAAFGMPVPIEPWEKFAKEAHLPVVIDAAGALTEQQVSQSTNLITTFSLHATKFIGAGEGGAIASADRFLLQRIAGMASFGQWGTNAKMSEYHAAVALASLDRIVEKTERMTKVTTYYRAGLKSVSVALHRPLRADATLFPVLLPDTANVTDVQTALERAGIETRQWYRPFLDELQQFANAPRAFKLPTTKMLRERMLGLPYHSYLSQGDVHQVCKALKEALK